ncbi:MAG: metal ABC transporter permease [Acidimicrobiia bacterium]
MAGQCCTPAPAPCFCCSRECGHARPPAAAARLVTNRLLPKAGVALGFGVVSVLTGLTLSFHVETAPGATVARCSVAIQAVRALATVPRRHHQEHIPATR